jgi:hypothetical protein
MHRSLRLIVLTLSLSIIKSAATAAPWSGSSKAEYSSKSGGLFTSPLLLATAFSYFKELLPLRSCELPGLHSGHKDTCSQSVLIRRDSERLRAYSLYIKYAATTAPWSGTSKVKYSSKSGVFSHPHYFSPPPSLTLMSFYHCAPESRLVCSLVIKTPAASLSSSEETAKGSKPTTSISSMQPQPLLGQVL